MDKEKLELVKHELKQIGIPDCVIKFTELNNSSDIMTIYGIQPELLGPENAITYQPPTDGCSRLAVFNNIVKSILK